MKQHEVVIEALERFQGVATLADIYKEALRTGGRKWKTKTPQATIRRIVQTRPEIYKLKPGLYGLVSQRQSNEASGFIASTERSQGSDALRASNHSYYQGLLLRIGRLRSLDCWAPNQDRSKVFLNQTIGELRNIEGIPQFSYPRLVHRSSTVDVIWFNRRGMPDSFFEVEHTTDIQNSLVKFDDLQDFHAQMVIVADASREREFRDKLCFAAFEDIRKRVNFLGFEALVRNFELISMQADSQVRL
jgi:hypothetical protein